MGDNQEDEKGQQKVVTETPEDPEKKKDDENKDKDKEQEQQPTEKYPQSYAFFVQVYFYLLCSFFLL